MTPEAQRIAIAEACPEIIERRRGLWFYRRKDENSHPYWEQCLDNDPLSDLNAMHEAEEVLPKNNGRRLFALLLRNVVTQSNMNRDDQAFDLDDVYAIARATAAQRAEAFLRTLGRWTE